MRDDDVHRGNAIVDLNGKLPLPLRRGAFSSPGLVCSKIRDQIGPPGQPTCADESQRFLSCRNIGLRSAKDGLKSYFSRSLSGKSLAEPYRISIERFTTRVPKMPKYNTGDGFDMINRYAEHRESKLILCDACDKCLNAPFCEQRTKCESDDGCYDFVEAVKIDAKL